MENQSPDTNKIAEMANEAKSVSSTEFMKPGSKKKGRPKLTDQEKAERAKKQKENVKTDNPQNPQDNPQPQGIPSKEICKPLAHLISQVGVNYTKVAQAAMTPQELENVATAMGLCMDKYMPVIMTKYAAECMLVYALGTWSIRIVAIKKLVAMEEKKKAENVKKDIHNVTPNSPQTPHSGPVDLSQIRAMPDNFSHNGGPNVEV